MGLIGNLVADLKNTTDEVDRLHLVNSEKEEANQQLRSDLAPLEFEIATMRDRCMKLNKNLKHQQDSEAQIKTLRNQNQVMRSKISQLKSELHAVQVKGQAKVEKLRSALSKLHGQKGSENLKRFRAGARKQTGKREKPKTKQQRDNLVVKVKQHSSRPRRSLTGLRRT